MTMRDCLRTEKPADAIALIPVLTEGFEDWLQQQDEPVRRWLRHSGFNAKRNSVCLLPGAEQTLAAVYVGVALSDDVLWCLGGLPATLPAGSYFLDTTWSVEQLERASLGWALGGYQFSRYREAQPRQAELVLDPACNATQVRQQAQAIALVRDLINTPAEDMLPPQLATAVVALAEEFSADVQQIVGDDLLQHNYPTIHAVGRASAEAPRLIDLRWGDESHPKLTLIGKGVCFDSGGLDIKPANGMRLMKKDMGGAAHAIGLARLVMSAGLPVRLRLLVAAVENAISGNAIRPGDVIRTRQGLTVEIDNTDAEGRLILCDALAEAVTEKPDLMVDFATLTGAARVALGTEVPGFFCNDDTTATGLQTHSEQECDPIWRLPLHQPYRELLDSRIADMVNSASTGFGGAITAALFLQAFVPDDIPWAHFDLMAWNTRSKPGRPEGGEAMGLRAVFGLLEQRYS